MLVNKDSTKALHRLYGQWCKAKQERHSHHKISDTKVKLERYTRHTVIDTKVKLEGYTCHSVSDTKVKQDLYVRHTVNDPSRGQCYKFQIRALYTSHSQWYSG